MTGMAMKRMGMKVKKRYTPSPHGSSVSRFVQPMKAALDATRYHANPIMMKSWKSDCHRPKTLAHVVESAFSICEPMILAVLPVGNSSCAPGVSWRIWLIICVRRSSVARPPSLRQRNL